jgi:hypothetical protein
MTGQKILGKLYKSGIGCGDILSILYFKLKISLFSPHQGSVAALSEYRRCKQFLSIQMHSHD